MLYFIKDGTVHKFPTPARCPVKYEDEQQRDTVPAGVEECVYCMRRWPEDDIADSGKYQY